MARPSHISDAQILQAAQCVFLERGFHEATTALIAERAGISEGSIFNHFKDKATLFCSSMEFGTMAIVEGLTGRAGQGDPRGTLEEITLAWIDFMLEMVPKIMMLWSHRAAVGSLGEANHGPPPEVVERVSGYFRTEMDLGRMRSSDPEILARIWLGALWNYAIVQVMGGAEARGVAKQTFAHAVVNQLWHGLAPQAVPAPEVQPLAQPAAPPLSRRKHR